MSFLRKLLVITALPVLIYSCKEQASEIEINTHVPAGEAVVLKYDAQEGALRVEEPASYNRLTETARRAIDQVPAWLRNDLREVLAQLECELQDKWAGLILDSRPPYQDEVAFSIAALSPEYLSSEYAYPEMFSLNAELVYHFDSLLQYVEIIEKDGPDGPYTTTRYRYTEEPGGEVKTYELPREVYYWYVAHPKIGMEVPAFVKPEVDKNYNAMRNLTCPDSGRFWREYVIYHGDEDIPNEHFPDYKPEEIVTNHANKSIVDSMGARLLVQHFLDSIRGVDILWDSQPVHKNGVKLSYANDYILAYIHRYVFSTMRYQRFFQTPQPVNILKWGLGNCGEHDALTAALARALLIPTAGAMCLASDHTWNAFWFRGQWLEWEPGGAGWIDPFKPDTTGKGEGEHYSKTTVFLRRSDGVLFDHTPLYSHTYTTLEVQVSDKNGTPIDGVPVMLYSNGSGQFKGGFALDNLRSTDHEGKARFLASEDRKYYFLIKRDKERIRAYINDTLDVEAGKTYTASMQIDTLITVNEFAQAEQTTEGEGELNMELECGYEIVYGRTIPYNTLYRPYPGKDVPLQVREKRQSGKGIKVLKMNKEQYEAWKKGEGFDAQLLIGEQEKISEKLKLNEEEDAYFLFYNDNVRNSVQVSGHIQFH